MGINSILAIFSATMLYSLSVKFHVQYYAYAIERAQQEWQKHGKCSFRSTHFLSASVTYTQYVLANKGRHDLA